MRCLLLLLLCPIFLFADTEVLKDRFVHEAYIPKDQGEIILQALPQKPPADLTERIPSNSMHGAKWIPGYWSWSQQDNDFIWVSGTWRVPPPGHVWIEGKWKSFSEGWVWLPGFWSSVEEADLTYINRPPPDRVDENVKNPPSYDYFWIPGHWKYDEEKRDFVWYRGRWQEFNENWQYVPAHYVWREKGYILVEGYWDWGLEDRGTAYACVSVPQDDRGSLAYLPSYVIEPNMIMHIYYPYWPDYFLLFHFWYFWNPDFDFGWGGIPPWWGWNDWWAFNGVDLWWLWWWWAHPGFPHPFFIDAVLSGILQGPPQQMMQMMQHVVPPLFMVPGGVVGVQDLVHAIQNVTHRTEPILPASPRMIEEIKQDALPTKKPVSPLRPSGKEKPKYPPQKPFFGPNMHDFSQPAERVKPPEYPTGLPSVRPPTEVIKPRTPAPRRAPTFEKPYEESAPQVNVPPPPVRQNTAPHRYIPRNNTRVRPPRPESWPQGPVQQEVDHQPRSTPYFPQGAQRVTPPNRQNYTPPHTQQPRTAPSYTPPSQTYQPRHTPQTYQAPEKPQYTPQQTAPHPTYTPPPQQPTNKYNKRTSMNESPSGKYYPKPSELELEEQGIKAQRYHTEIRGEHQGYKVPPKSDVDLHQQNRDALMSRYHQYERPPTPKPHQDY